MELTFVLRAFAALLLVGLPALAVHEPGRGEELEEALGRRSAVYLSGGLSLVLLAGATHLVALWQGAEAAELGWRVTAGASSAGAWAAGATAAGLVLAYGASVVARRLGAEESRLALYLIPRTRGERWGFVALALVAAVCEEYVYRGFALHVVASWSGSAGLAVAVTSVSFGLAHGYQRLGGVLRATLLGAVLALPVVSTGSLFPAVVAHFWINCVIGLGGWRLLVAEESLP